MKIKNKLIISFAIAIFFSTLMAGWGGYTLYEHNVHAKKMARDLVVPLTLIGQISSDFGEISTFFNTLTTSSGSKDMEDISNKYPVIEKRFLDNITAYKSELTGVYQQTDEYKNLEKLETIFKETVAPTFDTCLSYAKAGNTSAAAKEFSNTVLPVYRDMVHLLDANIQICNDYLTIESDSLDEQVIHTLLIYASIFLISVVILIVCAFIIIRSITKPIRTITSLAEEIAKGNLNQDIHSDSTDEMGTLSNIIADIVDTFNSLMLHL